jgi:hypothetical protein
MAKEVGQRKVSNLDQADVSCDIQPSYRQNNNNHEPEYRHLLRIGSAYVRASTSVSILAAVAASALLAASASFSSEVAPSDSASTELSLVLSTFLSADPSTGIESCVTTLSVSVFTTFRGLVTVSTSVDAGGAAAAVVALGTSGAACLTSCGSVGVSLFLVIDGGAKGWAIGEALLSRGTPGSDSAGAASGAIIGSRSKGRVLTIIGLLEEDAPTVLSD